jgi:hypothetical protein
MRVVMLQQREGRIKGNWSDWANLARLKSAFTFLGHIRSHLAGGRKLACVVPCLG